MDSPTLVTALLSSTRELTQHPRRVALPHLRRSGTSPHFAFDTRPSARVWGTDSAAFVFSVDADATVKAYENKNRAFSGPSELDTLNPSLVGPAAFLSSFAKGYLGRCESQARLRMARATTATALNHVSRRSRTSERSASSTSSTYGSTNSPGLGARARALDDDRHRGLLREAGFLREVLETDAIVAAPGCGHGHKGDRPGAGGLLGGAALARSLRHDDDLSRTLRAAVAS